MGKFIGFLRETDLFYNLSPLQLEMVDSVCEEKLFHENELVFSENSLERELYLIFRGEIEIFVNPGLVSGVSEAQSKPEFIASLPRGQSFGEVALVDQGTRTASARASARDTVLLKISRDRLINLCNSYPELGYRVMSNLAQALAQKMRNADLKIREVLLYQNWRSGSPY
jgi:CRP-like cAMP-binding protein